MSSWRVHSASLKLKSWASLSLLTCSPSAGPKPRAFLSPSQPTRSPSANISSTFKMHPESELLSPALSHCLGPQTPCLCDCNCLLAGFSVSTLASLQPIFYTAARVIFLKYKFDQNPPVISHVPLSNLNTPQGLSSLTWHETSLPSLS